jgi:hypothetical protein
VVIYWTYAKDVQRKDFGRMSEPEPGLASHRCCLYFKSNLLRGINRQVFRWGFGSVLTLGSCGRQPSLRWEGALPSGCMVAELPHPTPQGRAPGLVCGADFVLVPHFKADVAHLCGHRVLSLAMVSAGVVAGEDAVEDGC